jgi:peptidoglycan/xylan/chitin deacetylase (PgdA/CDA1 family)
MSEQDDKPDGGIHRVIDVGLKGKPDAGIQSAPGVQSSAKKEFGAGKAVVLTFDDGPEPIDALIDILEALEDKEVRAEFYLQGNKIKDDSPLQLILDGKHSLQNHTWSHSEHLLKKTEPQIYREISDTQDAIRKRTGVSTTKLRPPYGKGAEPKHVNPTLNKIAQQLQMRLVYWDVDTEDWAATEGLADVPLKRHNGKTRHKFIEEQVLMKKRQLKLDFLMHVRRETAKDLPDFIKNLKDWGFEIVDPNKDFP